MGAERKLVTFQTMEALKKLVNNGYLECEDRYVNTCKMGAAYDWILENMERSVKKEGNAHYPLWAWVKFKRGIYPPKHKREEAQENVTVRITFLKNEKDMLITDYRRYSFILNNLYIPVCRKDKEWFFHQMETENITREELKAYVRPDKYRMHRTDKGYLDLCARIRASWDRCITEDSDVLQACVWRINLCEVVSIELLQDGQYDYGTFNYVRGSGKRFDWQEDFYRRL